ncbi:MAG TPA: MerR family transcriptional regulator [Candidatus Eisenbacteria bacterium]|nr:MerR family transcriptional regulator [Candidatus Eisenbacteria bacterium]
MDDLLPIGRFARLTGLSIGALRHYDELDVLRPADVDRSSGYRRYRRDQLETGRTIARLRELEVPIEEIRRILGSDDPAEQRRRLAEHRSRVEARTNRLQRQLHVLQQLSTGKEPLVSETTATTLPSLDPATHRQLGVDLFNHVWTLIEKADRSAAETDEMIHAAHASRYHWSKAGTTVNLARGEWQCARVYSVLGRGEPALWHAHRCLELAEAAARAGEAEPWDVPAAYEAMARASAIAGDRAAALEWRTRAREGVAGIAEPEDREIIEGDIATLPL